jgi:thioredoxin-dependent peroxiredoxin
MPLLMPLLLLLAAPDAAKRPAVGEAAPAFEAASTEGGQARLSDHVGKHTLVLAFFPKAFTGG